jgi:hypothetical protein
MNLLTPADGKARLLSALFHNRTDGGVGRRLVLRRPTPPRCPLIPLSDYRIFTTVVLACIVSLDVWSDLRWSPFISMYVVGPSSVLVWALTLVGSFGIGPVHKIWNALSLRRRSGP